MAVFRVEKTDNYTVMSNYHLRDRSISLKAKGLLSQMLSLPPEWDYTLQGLAYINKEGINSVREGVKELEKAGYIKRRRVRGDKGLFAGNEYVIRELPESEKPSYENRTLDNRTLENPTYDNETQVQDVLLYYKLFRRETRPFRLLQLSKQHGKLFSSFHPGSRSGKDGLGTSQRSHLVRRPL